MWEYCKKILFWVAILLTFAFRVLITPRLHVPSFAGTYEAFSHLFIGGLLGCWLIDPQGKTGHNTKLWALLALGSSLWELAWYLAQR